MIKVIDYTESVETAALSVPLDYIEKTLERGEHIWVIGIASGGIPISEQVVDKLKNLNYINIAHSAIVCQRPSTKSLKKKNKKREGTLKKIFEVLPISILNCLRILEHSVLSLRRKAHVRRDVILKDEYGLEAVAPRLILIVDDAVDSGFSLKAVKEYISDYLLVRKFNDVTVKTFAVTVTQKNPYVFPDFYWKKNVLIRFPWSLDAKENII